MKPTLQDRLGEIFADAKKNSKTIKKLIALKKESNDAFEKRISHLLARSGIVKKIKVPKLHIKLGRLKIPINWRYIISMPFIYEVFLPALIFHLCIEIYHQICFRLYKIPLVDSKEYFIYDRPLLSMLNPLEKINCIYCSYVNNLIRYSAEIGGRTERYWCPIKYYRRINNAHSQYPKFVGREDAKEMRELWEELRDFSDIEED